MFIGNVEVAQVSDGRFKLDGGALFGVVPRVLWERVHTPDAQHRLGLALNSLVIRSQGKTILVDTGFGPKLTPRQVSTFALERETDLLRGLAGLGLRPQDVDVVINTHLHFDHCGGNTRQEGDRVVPTFPNAEYWVQRKEWEDALHPNLRTRATYFSENLLPLQEAGQLRLIDGPAAVTDEVHCIPAPGHTRGHHVVWITSGGRSAVCLGDLAQFRVHMERPAWISAYDTEPLVSLETKLGLLQRAAAEGAVLLFVHNDLIATVEAHGESYRLVPLP